MRHKYAVNAAELQLHKSCVKKNIMLMKALIAKARLKDLLNKIDAAFETKQNFGAIEIEDYKKTLKFPWGD